MLPILSTIGVTESDLNTSLGAGTANQIKFGVITTKNNNNPQKSKPNLYFFNMFLLKTPICTNMFKVIF